MSPPKVMIGFNIVKYNVKNMPVQPFRHLKYVFTIDLAYE
jgi:hypothetical protein